MQWLGWLVLAGVGLILLDRVALWAESRGWIYWRKRRGTAGAGDVLGGITDLFQPGHKHLVAERQRREVVPLDAPSGAPRLDVDLDRGIARLGPAPNRREPNVTGPTTPTTPGRLLVVQHVPWEEPGLIATLADESGLAVDTMLAGSGREPSLDGCAGLVLMGGPMGALDDDRHPWLAGERRLVRDAVAAELPTLGICLGHQLIAVALGGTLQPGATEEIGVSGVQLTRDSALGSADERPDVLHWHRDNVTAPPGAQVLASTPGCPVQAFRCGSALGLQFHLEVDPALLTRWLAVPEMVRDLPGDCPPDALLDALRAAAASQQRLARSVFGAFLDRVAGTSRQAGPA